MLSGDGKIGPENINLMEIKGNWCGVRYNDCKTIRNNGPLTSKEMTELTGMKDWQEHFKLIEE
jgi:hypothetical protein